MKHIMTLNTRDIAKSAQNDQIHKISEILGYSARHPARVHARPAAALQTRTAKTTSKKQAHANVRISG